MQHRVEDKDQQPPASHQAMFRLTEQEILEFRDLVHESRGVWISPEIAGREAEAMLTLTRIIIGPLPEEMGDAPVRASSLLPYSAEAS